MRATELGAPLVLQPSTRTQLPRPVRVRPRHAVGLTRIASASPEAAARSGERGPALAQQRPPTGDGVEYEQMRQPVMVAAAGGLRHHPDGAPAPSWWVLTMHW